MHRKRDGVDAAIDPTWYPGLVVPAEEVLDGMLDEDDAEDFEDFDERHDVVVKLFEDKSYILAELAHVRVLDPNKSPYIACVASDEGFIQQKCKPRATEGWSKPTGLRQPVTMFHC